MGVDDHGRRLVHDCRVGNDQSGIRAQGGLRLEGFEPSRLRHPPHYGRPSLRIKGFRATAGWTH